MKRTLIAWVLLLVMVLGATPALAAGPVQDIIDWSQPSPGTTVSSGTGAPVEVDADTVNDVMGTVSDDAVGPTQSVVSVSGGLYAADEKGAGQPGDGSNTAPVAENQQIQTYRGVSVGGQLTAYDA